MAMPGTLAGVDYTDEHRAKHNLEKLIFRGIATGLARWRKYYG